MTETQRDGRTMNHMDPDTKRIHALLERWSRWAKDHNEAGGWASRTILGRVAEEGPHGALSSGPPPISMPDEVATIDAAVAKLGEIDRLVVRTYYLKWQPVETMARHCHMRVREFKTVLRRARWRITGFVDGWRG